VRTVNGERNVPARTRCPGMSGDRSFDLPTASKMLQTASSPRRQKHWEEERKRDISSIKRYRFSICATALRAFANSDVTWMCERCNLRAGVENR